jgi:PAS domain S-box-containing protein
MNKTLNLKTGMIGVVLCLAILMVLVGAIGHSGMNQGEAGMQDAYKNEVVQFLFLKTVSDVYSTKIPHLCQSVLTGESTFDEARKQILAERRNAQNAWDRYMSGSLEPDEKELAKKILALKDPLDLAMAKLTNILRDRDRDGLHEFCAKEIYDSAEPYRAKIQTLFEKQEGDAARTVKRTEQAFATMRILLRGSVGVGILLAAFLLAYLVRLHGVLHQSMERYRSLVTATAQMIWRTDANGNVIDDLPTWRAFTGQSLEAVKGRGWLAALHHEDAGRASVEWSDALRKTALYETEYRVRRSDGEYHDFAVRSLPVLDRRGRVQEWVGACMDITERKHVERRRELTSTLLELFARKSSSTEYLDSVLEVVRKWTGCQNLGIRILEENYLHPYRSSAGFDGDFLEQEGQRSIAAEFCDCACFMRQAPELQKPEFESSRDSFFCGNVADLKGRLPANQQGCYCEVCLQQGFSTIALLPLKYEDQILGLLHLVDRRPHYLSRECVKVLESVSPLIGEAIHRFKVEESLRESEQRFRTMFESHQSAMLLIDPASGAVVDANPAAVTLYGSTRKALCSVTVEELRMVLPEVGRRGRGFQVGEKGAHLETSIRLSTGEFRIVEVRSSAVIVQGQPRLFAILHDITERKRIEKLLLGLSEEERQHVGRELHESLGQKLAGAAMANKVLSLSLAGQSNSELSLADEIGTYLKEAIIETRSIAKGVCPVGLSHAGLAGDLHEMAGVVEKQSRVVCRVRADESVIIHEEMVAAQIYRIAQEAVDYAIDRRQAKTLTIELFRKDGDLILEVTNDSHAGPEEGVPMGDFRLGAMQYRAEAIGCRFEVEQGQLGVDIVRCTLPSEVVYADPLSISHS